jgi:hypothetical protein
LRVFQASVRKACRFFGSLSEKHSGSDWLVLLEIKVLIGVSGVAQ